MISTMCNTYTLTKSAKNGWIKMKYDKIGEQIWKRNSILFSMQIKSDTRICYDSQVHQPIPREKYSEFSFSYFKIIEYIKLYEKKK